MTVLERVRAVAATDLAVLILGETGTGKEVLARFIHSLSTRNSRNFVAVNCAAITKELFDTEMFGHKKGSFTGAQSDKRGLIEAADGGTLLLDEVGDMQPEHQAKLLRVLQEHETRRVGETHTRDLNVRIIAATNRKLEAEVDSGRFRRDLYFRLNGVTISLPRLSQRKGDIQVLAEHFLKENVARSKRPIEGFSERALLALEARSWPGNVRELEQAIVRAVAMCSQTRIEPEDFGFPSDKEAIARGNDSTGKLQFDGPSAGPTPSGPASDGSTTPHQTETRSPAERIDEQFIQDLGKAFNVDCEHWERLPEPEAKALRERLKHFASVRLGVVPPRLKDLGKWLVSAIKNEDQLAHVAARAWTISLQACLEDWAMARTLQRRIKGVASFEPSPSEIPSPTPSGSATGVTQSAQPIVLGLCGDLDPSSAEHVALVQRLIDAVLALKKRWQIPSLEICFVGGGARSDRVDLAAHAIARHGGSLRQCGIAISAAGIPAHPAPDYLQRLDEPVSAWRRCSAVVSIGGNANWIQSHSKSVITNPSRKPWLGLAGAGGESALLFRELRASIYGPTVAALSSWEINELEVALPHEMSLVSALHSLLLYRKPDEPLEADVEEFLEDIQRAEGNEKRRRALIVAIASNSLRAMGLIDQCRAFVASRLLWVVALLTLAGGLAVATTVLLNSPLVGHRRFLVFAGQSESVVHVVHSGQSINHKRYPDLAKLLCSSDSYKGNDADRIEADANTNLLMTKWNTFEETRNQSRCDSAKQYILVDDSLGAIKVIRLFGVSGKVSVLAQVAAGPPEFAPRGVFIKRTDQRLAIVKSTTETVEGGMAASINAKEAKEVIYVGIYPKASAGPASGWIVYPYGLDMEGDVTVHFGRSGTSASSYSDFIPARVLSGLEVVVEAFQLNAPRTVGTQRELASIGAEFQQALSECGNAIEAEDARISVALKDAASRGGVAMWLTPKAALESRPRFYYVFQYRRGAQAE